MKLSIRWKILIVLVPLVLFSVILGTFLHIQTELQSRTEEMQSRAVAMGQVIGLKFANQLLTDAPVSDSLKIEMDVWLSEIADVRYVAVFNSNGKNIFHSFPGKQTGQVRLDLSSPIFKGAMNSNKKLIGRELEQVRIYDMLVPIKLFSTDFGLVRIGFNISDLYAQQRQIMIYNGLMGTLLVLLAIVIAYLVAGWVSKPIEQLEQVTARLGRGDLSARASIESGDEIEDLANRFNEMAKTMQGNIEDLKTIEQLNRKISAKLRPEDLHDHIVYTLHEFWKLDYIALMLYADENKQLQVEAGIEVKSPYFKVKADEWSLTSVLSKPSQNYLRIDEPDVLDELGNIFRIEQDEIMSEAIVFPLQTGSNDLGYLILGEHDGQIDTQDLDLIQTLTYQIKIAIENANHYTRAVTDDLTGLYTRRFFDLQLRSELDNPENRAVSLAMVDIDNFKSYNDTYGHPAGDEVLISLANTFEDQVRTADTREAIRKPDTVGRYGGEEFAIILPDTDLESAASVCSRIVQTVAAIDEFERQITISVGVAEARPEEEPKSLITRADQALYRAKEEGKNRVCKAD